MWFFRFHLFGWRKRVSFPLFVILFCFKCVGRPLKSRLSAQNRQGPKLRQKRYSLKWVRPFLYIYIIAKPVRIVNAKRLFSFSFCWNLFVLTFFSVGRHSARCLQRPSARGCFVRLFHVEQFECSILKVAPKKRRTISLAALCKTECSMWNNATESLGCCPIKAAASAGDALQKSCKNRCFYSPSKKPAGIPAFLTRSRSVWPFGFVETSVDVAANDS